MIARAATRHHDRVLHLRAFRCGDNLAVLNLVARRLKEAERRLLCRCVLVLIRHAGSVNRVAVYILRECNLVTVVGRLRCRPGGVGNRIVDDARSVAVVGADREITVCCKNGCEAAAQVLRSIAARLLVDRDVVRVHADVTVAQCIDRNRVNLVARNFAVAVCLLDGIRNLVRVGRICDICRAGKNRVDVVGLVDVAHAKILGLRLTLVVVRICLQRDNTVLVLVKDIRACAERLRGLRTNQAEVALREAELVVCVVVLRLVAVVVKRRNNDADLVDGLCVDFRRDNAECIVTSLLDTADVRCGSAGLNTDCEILVVIHELGERRSRALLVGHILHAAVILGEHCVEEIHCGRIRLEIRIAVVRSDSRNRVTLFVGTARNAGIHDFFHKRLSGLVVRSPELLLLIFGPLGEVRVVLTRLDHQVKEGVDTGSVLFHALNRKGKEGRGAVIGRIRVDVHRENHIVNRQRLAVRELDAVLQLKVVVDGAVAVLRNRTIRNAVVGILLAVILSGLALNALQDDGAVSICGKKAGRELRDHIRIRHGLIKERRELTVELTACVYQAVTGITRL